MPTRYAIRELALNYEEEVKQQIRALVEHQLPYDFLDGKKRDEILNMTMSECEMLKRANEEIRKMAETGDLQ